MSDWRTVAALADIPDGTTQLAVAGDDTVLLVRSGRDVHAVSPVCPHKFTSLDDGAVDAAGHLTCSLHGACFDLTTGAPRRDQAWAGRLPVYPCRVVDGLIQVRLH